MKFYLDTSLPVPGSCQETLGARGLDAADDCSAPSTGEDALLAKGDTVRTVLLVDDQEDILTLAGAALSRSRRYSVLRAKDGREALELLESNRPDLVLLDVMMPGRDGYQVCRDIKAVEGNETLPVMLFTVRNRADDFIRGFEAGAVGFIVKSPGLLDLVDQVDRVLERVDLVSGST